MSLGFSDAEVRNTRVEKRSEASGKTPGDIDLRKKYEVTVLAISRNHKFMYDPRAETELGPDNILLVISSPEKLEGIRGLFESSPQQLPIF